MPELFLTPALSRAIVVGAFGGAALVLTAVYSRRGPTILVPYAGLGGAIALLLSRYSTLSYGGRFVAALAGFLVATILLYAAVGVLARRARQQRRRDGKLPAPVSGISAWGRTWRLTAVSALAVIACAGIAYVAA
jgi:hypothetical protein